MIIIITRFNNLVHTIEVYIMICFPAGDAEGTTADQGTGDQERTTEEGVTSKDGGSDSDATQTPQRLHLGPDQVRYSLPVGEAR